MLEPETELNFACPYCWRTNSITADICEGYRQEFVVDCENCCNPILLDINLKNGNIEAKRENE